MRLYGHDLFIFPRFLLPARTPLSRATQNYKAANIYTVPPRQTDSQRRYYLTFFCCVPAASAFALLATEYNKTRCINNRTNTVGPHFAHMRANKLHTHTLTHWSRARVSFAGAAGWGSDFATENVLSLLAELFNGSHLRVSLIPFYFELRLCVKIRAPKRCVPHAKRCGGSKIQPRSVSTRLLTGGILCALGLCNMQISQITFWCAQRFLQRKN